MTRQMAMVGFLQAQNCTNLPCSWRHPQSRGDAHSADYYQEIARILEAGKFHMAFFDDRLAMPDRYGSDHAHTVEYGIRATKMDPLIGPSGTFSPGRRDAAASDGVDRA